MASKHAAYWYAGTVWNPAIHRVVPDHPILRSMQARLPDRSLALLQARHTRRYLLIEWLEEPMLSKGRGIYVDFGGFAPNEEVNVPRWAAQFANAERIRHTRAIAIREEVRLQKQAELRAAEESAAYGKHMVKHGADPNDPEVKKWLAGNYGIPESAEDELKERSKELESTAVGRVSTLTS